MLRIALVLLTFVLTASGVNAQTPQQVLKDFGLLGTWANDCSKPAASNNFLTIYQALSNGEVKRTYYDAPNKIYSEFVIKRVTRLAPDQILYEQEGQNDLQFVVLKKNHLVDDQGSAVPGGEVKYRVFSNHSRAGKQYVENGKYVKDSPATHGNDTPWQTKCHD